ncbi:c-type cytochrome biogenesis protein CcmI [Manganibacter manganicus]|uniref:C-type cytochrome biogenesis protein CcmI n=1 Tax=Manganibacter manganicus TaxID=1873176 RepID=A0A1V8RK64_9HYPH|nr:c-type cytochrome biogenesis protein CcmI [Pseudaminobacter manganicus]OQM73598.1 c-type cytochrome biogenesis protein CcmI [Pseudaminobacter manganicus]
MVFWVIAALLTLGASLAVLLPLTRRPKTAPAGAEHDLEVYRDQLAELDKDTERGLIPPSDAQEARAEVARRIIRVASAEKQANKAEASAPRDVRLIAAAAVLAVPLISWGLYGALGSPDLPSQPLADRLTKNPADSSVDELIARAESHLAENPNDGRGWDVLAPVYLRMQRFSDSATAYRNAIRLEGSTAGRQAGLGEALANQQGGMISAEAQSAFQAALKLDPKNAKAQFFLAVGLAQEGRKQDAVAALRKMLADLPQNSSWRNAVEQALAESGDKVADADRPAGPDQNQIDAAASMSPQDRQAMIETMVASLDDRLRHNPDDAEGWQKLIRSYAVLDRKAEALDALDRAVAAFGKDSEEAKKLVAFAASVGIARKQ